MANLKSELPTHQTRRVSRWGMQTNQSRGGALLNIMLNRLDNRSPHDKIASMMCGVTVPKTLSVRTHQCPHWGLAVDRDENAALNILQRVLCVVGNSLSTWVSFDKNRPVQQDARVTGGSPLSFLA